jgi:hypothetical protein
MISPCEIENCASLHCEEYDCEAHVDREGPCDAHAAPPEDQCFCHCPDRPPGESCDGCDPECRCLCHSA